MELLSNYYLLQTSSVKINDKNTPNKEAPHTHARAHTHNLSLSLLRGSDNKKTVPIMEPKNSWPYPKHIKSSVSRRPCFLKGHINITLPSIPRSNTTVFPSDFKLKLFYEFSSSA